MAVSVVSRRLCFWQLFDEKDPHEALPNLLERLKRTMTIYGLLNDEESGLGGSPPRGAGESTMLMQTNCGVNRKRAVARLIGLVFVGVC